jgi:hypothetical protein
LIGLPEYSLSRTTCVLFDTTIDAARVVGTPIEFKLIDHLPR